MTRHDTIPLAYMITCALAALAAAGSISWILLTIYLVVFTVTGIVVWRAA